MKINACATSGYSESKDVPDGPLPLSILIVVLGDGLACSLASKPVWSPYV
ncbi:hypothetical protein [Acinetobacter sp.]